MNEEKESYWNGFHTTILNYLRRKISLHDSQLSVKDPCSLESRLFFMLSYGISKVQDATTNIYDMAWGLLALRYLGENNRHLSEMIQEAVSIIEGKSSEELAGYLYDFRRAVGVALSIYILGREKLHLSETTLEEICKNSVENSEGSEIGELIGATFLLLKYLNRKNFEDKIKNLMQKMIEKGMNEPEFRFIDLLYVAFFAAMVNDELYIEIVKKMSQNEFFIEEYIMNDPETLALFLYPVSKVAELKNGQLSEWSKEKREEAANALRELLRSIYINFDFYRKSNASKREDLNEMFLERDDMDSHYLRPDLLSKIMISFYEAGYIYPFTLSKKEADIYRQIKAEVKMYRRVRKYELFSLFVLSSLFLIMLPILWNLIFIMKVNLVQLFQINSAFVRFVYLFIFSITLFIWGSIWRNGYVSPLELLKQIYKKLTEFVENNSG